MNLVCVCVWCGEHNTQYCQEAELGSAVSDVAIKCPYDQNASRDVSWDKGPTILSYHSSRILCSAIYQQRTYSYVCMDVHVYRPGDRPRKEIQVPATQAAVSTHMRNRNACRGRQDEDTARYRSALACDAGAEHMQLYTAPRWPLFVASLPLRDVIFVLFYSTTCDCCEGDVISIMQEQQYLIV